MPCSVPAVLKAHAVVGRRLVTVDLSGLEQTVRCPICYGEALHGSAAGWYVPFAVSVGSGEQERHVRVQHARRHAEEHAAVNGMRPPLLCRVPGPLPAARGQVSEGNKQLPGGSLAACSASYVLHM